MTNSKANSVTELRGHMMLETQGKTAAEYTYEAMKLHQEQYKGKGKAPPAALQWMSNAALAVLPMNRIFCAIGLTAGLMTAGSVAKVATGFGLDGKAVESVPTYLDGIHKIVNKIMPKGITYHPKNTDSASKWVKYAQWGVYSLGGAVGIKLGTDYAYRKVKEKNKNPEYFEDYLTRVSMHQGETYSWMSAFTGIFGSASGLWMLPIPGLNYGMALAARTTSMQDRNIMLPGLNKMASGGATTSYLRMKEGLHYLCHYAIGNKAKDPGQFEFLAYTLLAPVFKEQLTAEHVKEFAETIHEVRDHFWKDGGIPKEKYKEGVLAMKEVFTGAGLEVLLINMGLNPATVQLEQMNGMMGKIGNIGARSAIRKDQQEFLKKFESRLETYVREGVISPERAQWAREGMEAAQHGKKQPPAPAAPKMVPSSEVLSPDIQITHETVDVPGKGPAFTGKTEVSVGAMSREDPVDKLVRKSTETKEDWRARAMGKPQETRTAAFTVE